MHINANLICNIIPDDTNGWTYYQELVKNVTMASGKTYKAWTVEELDRLDASVHLELRSPARDGASRAVARTRSGRFRGFSSGSCRRRCSGPARRSGRHVRTLHAAACGCMRLPRGSGGSTWRSLRVALDTAWPLTPRGP